MSYKPEVIADSSGKWTGNALRFATEKEAGIYVKDLAMRWTLVTDTRVVQSDDPVTHRIAAVGNNQWDLESVEAKVSRTNEAILADAIDVIALQGMIGGDPAKAAETINLILSQMHRTRQQAFWNVIVGALIKYAAMDCDLRNQAAVEFAKDVRAMKDLPHPHHPFPLI